MKRAHTTLLIVAALTAALTSCLNDDNKGSSGTVTPAQSFYNFATYNGSTTDGSSFTIVREGDAPSATITFTNTYTDKQLAKGNRVFMAYYTSSGQEFASGPGTLFALNNVTGDPLEAATDANSPTGSTPIKLTQVTNTGDYLNVVFQIPSNGNLKTLKLTEATDAQKPGWPILGLYVRTDNDQADYRYARVSFDIASVLAPAEVEGVRFICFDDKGMDTLRFSKAGGSSTIKPVN